MNSFHSEFLSDFLDGLLVLFSSVGEVELDFVECPEEEPARQEEGQRGQKGRERQGEVGEAGALVGEEGREEEDR